MKCKLNVEFVDNNSITLKALSIEDTISIGYAISKYIAYPEIITLTGDLGMGKTLLARSIITYQLKYNEQVPSPSYLVCLTYKTENGNIINHIDPFRLKKTRPLPALIDYDNIINKDLCIIEWPNLVPDLFKNNSISTLNITITSDTFNTESRIIKLESCDSKWMSIFLTWNNTKYDIVNELSHNNTTEHDNLLLEHPPINITNKNYVLGIETSCDDTCAAIINGSGDIVSNVRIGQEDIHKEFRGVNPKYAQQSHMENIDKALHKAFENANITPNDINAVAVTQGPGLEICLLIGLHCAHIFSKKYKIPLIKCHHLESHVAVSRLPSLNLNIEYPFLSVLVSGGHSMIIYMKGLGDYKVLSTTLDDSIGECFDKIARELGIEIVPGGPQLEKLASNGKSRFPFRTPYIKASPYNMSFSGIKSSTIKLIRNQHTLTEDIKADIACSFQEFVTKYLIKKIYASMEILFDKEEVVTSVVVAGGVASNKYIRNELEIFGRKNNVSIKYPPVNLCTDNGVMVAWNGIERLRKGIYENYNEISDDRNHMDAFPRWKLG